MCLNTRYACTYAGIKRISANISNNAQPIFPQFLSLTIFMDIDVLEFGKLYFLAAVVSLAPVESHQSSQFYGLWIS